MGACATKSGDLKKVKGEPPVVEEDAAVPPPVAEGEKANTVEEVVPAAAETDPADVSRRRSLSDLLKEVTASFPFTGFLQQPKYKLDTSSLRA